MNPPARHFAPLHNQPTRAGKRVSTQTRIIEHLRRGVPRWPAQIAKELELPRATVDAHLRAITEKGTAPLRVVERRGYAYCQPSEAVATLNDLSARLHHLTLWRDGIARFYKLPALVALLLLTATAALADIAFVAHRGSATEKVSDASITLSPTATLPAGSVAITRCTTDDAGDDTPNSTEHALTDSTGSNTWTLLREYSFNPAGSQTGVTTSLWLSNLSADLTTGHTLTCTIQTNVTAKTILLDEFSVAAGKDVTAQANAADSAAAVAALTLSLSGLPSQPYLLLATTGAEGPNGDTWTEDTDYTPLTNNGTTGGSATTNIYNRAAYRIATLTADTYNPTGSNNTRDMAAALVALKETDEAAPPPRNRVVVIQ